MSAMDLLVLCCGVYVLYAAWILKRDGKITKSIMLFKEVDESSCKDVQGYADLMAPKLNLLGGVTVAYGGLGLFNTYVVDVTTLYWVMGAVFFAALIWYAVQARKATKKYF